MATPDVESCLKEAPLIAILRGITPAAVLDYAKVIIDAGWRCIEVPLNSPDPLNSIEKLSNYCGGNVLIGAGTVLDAESVEQVYNAGGRLIVAPHTDSGVIRAALSRKMVVMPGFLSPTEAFSAYAQGARYLKLFPADSMGPAYIKAIRSVLPNDAHIIPVGGVTPESLSSFRQAGGSAFGIGSQLYKPGMALTEVATQAQRFIAAL